MTEWSTKQEVLEEFLKAPEKDGGPRTMEELRDFIRRAIRSEGFEGNYIEFIFDTGFWAHDTSRYRSFKYKIKKEDRND